MQFIFLYASHTMHRSAASKFKAWSGRHAVPFQYWCRAMMIFAGVLVMACSDPISPPLSSLLTATTEETLCPTQFPSSPSPPFNPPPSPSPGPINTLPAAQATLVPAEGYRSSHSYWSSQYSMDAQASSKLETLRLLSSFFASSFFVSYIPPLLCCDRSRRRRIVERVFGWVRFSPLHSNAESTCC